MSSGTGRWERKKVGSRGSENVGRLWINLDFHTGEASRKTRVRGGGGVVADEVVQAVVLWQKA